MGHGHVHAGATGRKLGISIVLMALFVVIEAVAGVGSHSLALLSDAGHNFADVLALLLSWYGLKAANWPSSRARTFGYHRVGILTALANAAALVLIAGFIIVDAVARLRHPAPVAGGVMMAVAAAAVLVNAAVAIALHAGARDDLNIRSAYIHMLGDALSAAAVVVAGAVVAIFHTPAADPLVSIAIGVMILLSSWGVLKESVNVLLEGAPQGLDMCAVEQAIVDVAGVLDAHDLHVWTVGPGVVACSCHVIVAEQSVRSGQAVLRAVSDALAHRFRINHTTIQVEVEGCDFAEMYCTVRPHAHEHCHGHGHGADSRKAEPSQAGAGKAV